MTSQERFELLVTLMTLFFGTGVAFIVRVSMKWGRIETSLDNVINDVGELTTNKDKIHSEIVAQMVESNRLINAQMREDRAATNQRLRWLEENVWKGQTPHAI